MTADSVALNRIVAGAVILAGSGMATGGRVRHHLRHNLGRGDCVVLVGFAAVGTLAHQLVDGATRVRRSRRRRSSPRHGRWLAGS